MGSSTPAHRALSKLRQLLAGKGGWAVADWALTLHMLEPLAPRFFAEEELRPELARALAALEQLPAALPATLDEHEAMARVDAVYLRTMRGLPAKPLDPRALAEWIERHATDAPLQAWFIGELARALRLGAPKAFASRYPFETSSPLSHLYMLTHEVMLDTRFFARPVSLPDAPRIFDALAAALPRCIADREWDLVAELAFTLRSAGRDCSGAVAAIATVQAPDGGMGVAETPRESAHAVATALIALAAGHSVTG